MRPLFLLCLLLSTPALASAQAPAGVEGPSLMPMVFALVLVVALIPVAMWLLKKLGGAKIGASGGLRVVASLSLGQRERLVLVDDGNEYLLLGVTAHSITRLGALPRDTTMPPSPGATFSSLMNRARNRNEAK